MTITVLISAPYMIRVMDRFGPLLEGAGLKLIVPQVSERLSESELLPYAGQIDGAICGDDRFTAQVLEQAAPRLKVISKWGTGIDSIDLEAAARLGVSVKNTPGAFTDAVADSVMSYVLAFARGTPWMDREMKSGKWGKSAAVALHECTMGVVGVGRIGQAVLRRAKGFGMQLVGNDTIEVDSALVAELGVRIAGLESLLGECQFISLNCDLNPSSHHLIGDRQLELMRAEAVLVNTARGAIVDEQALIRALQSGIISGAALDVFEQEPLPADSPLRAMGNVLLAPHNANSSHSAWERVHWNTLRNLFEGLGLPFPNQQQLVAAERPLPDATVDPVGDDRRPANAGGGG